MVLFKHEDLIYTLNNRYRYILKRDIELETDIKSELKNTIKNC